MAAGQQGGQDDDDEPLATGLRVSGVGGLVWAWVPGPGPRARVRGPLSAGPGPPGNAFMILSRNLDLRSA